MSTLDPRRFFKLKKHFKYLSPLIYVLIISLTACNEGKKSKAIALSNEVVPELIDFNFHVKPILSDRCFACHGPDENARNGDLRLDTEKGAFSAIGEAKDHYAIIPGDLKNSVLIDRIKSTDPELVMPPPESNLTLSDTEIKILEKWIAQGAQWKKHWSFIPVTDTKIPEVQQTEWPANPVDNFILSKLENVGLTPEDQASKEVLIRRVTLDLTGIPPTLQEVDDFLNDKDPNAYEKVVDRLLASEAYGERMAVEWLDVARYADTNGYQDDLYRTMWPWRDWVIRSFNKNMPIDQFIKWQIAGDMYENAGYEQVLATAFNRNHMITQEGGVIDEEYRVEYVADRTNTTGTAILGLTMECARCHDHKYDPISTKEYYQLFSFYNNVPEKGQVPYDAIAKPSLKIPDSELSKIKSMLSEEIGLEQNTLVKRESRIKEDLGIIATRLRQHVDGNNATLPEGLVQYADFDYVEDGKLVSSMNVGNPVNFKGALQLRKGRFGRSIAVKENNMVDLGRTFSPGKDQAFSIGAWVYPSPKNRAGAIIAKMENGIKGRGYKGFDLFMEDEKIAIHLIDKWPFSAIKIKSKASVQFLNWTHIAFAYDGSGKADGLSLYINGQLQEVEVELDQLKGNFTNNEPLRIGRRNNNGAIFKDGLIDQVNIFDRKISPEEIAQLYEYNPISTIVANEMNTLSDAQKSSMVFHYLYNYDNDFQESTKKINNLLDRQQLLTDPKALEVLVMQEMPTPREARVLVRGGYENHGEVVRPATPTSVLPFSADLPKNRMGLATWLVDEKNPLTARVFVNRYWQLVFGTGIVATPGDFGSQGELPSHPELLDWLSYNFMTSGWDLKNIIKMMVTSSTYKQSSRITPDKYEIDPSNILLSRGPRFRLTAEMLRDQALALSGLLVDKVGGPPVRPYQPNGLWEEKTSGGGFTRYVQSKGQDLYRKSMYTYWKRTVPPPSMITFDASERNLCTVKRQSTSTPLQALVLLNDPQMIEASRVMAEKILKNKEESIEGQIKLAFRMATSRNGNTEEIQVLKEIFENELAGFEQNPEGAKSLIATGEYPVDTGLEIPKLAAFTIVVNTLFNLSESVTRG